MAESKLRYSIIVPFNNEEANVTELYDRLKSDPRTSDVPVLFETGTGDESLAEFRRRGIATYVKKPFDLNEVVEYVKKLADGGPASATTPPGSALPRHA